MLYVEPTPYVMSFVEKMRTAMQDGVGVLFIATDRSQAWNVAVPAQWCEVLPPGRLRAAARLSWWVNPKRCAVLHLAGWGHPLLLLAMMLATVRRIPIFLESDTQLPAREPRWKKAIKGLLYPVMFALPFRLLPGGSRQAAYMRHYGARPERILVARMTVDVTAIAREVDSRGARRGAIRAKLGLRDDDVVFLYVGRLTASKGVAVLVQAFLGVAGRHPGASLLVVGDGDARGSVEAAALQCDRILLPGRQGQDGLLDVYAAADVLVVPSLFEPWGLVVNEGMAAGLPVIATDAVGAGDDLVRHGVNGMRVGTGDAKALEGAMEDLLAETGLRAGMGRASRELISGWTQEGKAERVAGAWRAALLRAVA
jgi:glycosyltransferase involved in cell wall biosynthesis